jgi:hypothetical protein
MTDVVIAAIGRRVAVTASANGRERTPDSKKEFLIALSELCAAVREEAIDDRKAIANQKPAE